jgi:hypothetical protein
MQRVDNSSPGDTTLAAKSKALDVRINIRMRSNAAQHPSQHTQPSPVSLGIESLTIVANGKELFVPSSAFCDLANLRKAELNLKGKGTPVLVLEGGDASEGYKVLVQFDATRVRRRAFFSLLQPSKVLQETTYHLQVLQ